MPDRLSFLYITRILFFIVFLLGSAANILADDLAGRAAYVSRSSNYAPSSVLANGRWVKVEVTETGLQFISDKVLKDLGFNEPGKVNVFGYGGVVIPENIDSPDDLPVLPSIRTNDGIVFFGRNAIGWEKKPSGETVYQHLGHPYSDKSYYFLSDCLEEVFTPQLIENNLSPEGEIRSFTERIVHEQDLMMPMNTGRLMLGEDFKTKTSQTFSFQLPDNSGPAKITTAFGCKTSSGISSLVFTANGQQLSASTTDQMVASGSKLIVTTKTTKKIENLGDALDLTIKFNGSGNVSSANLDYIEIEYSRKLRLESGELYFYISPEKPNEVFIENSGQSTVIWDVTVPHDVKQIKTDYNNGSVSFVSEAGYHEYIAFEPGKVCRSITSGETVSNQDIHSLGAPDMLVICPKEFLSAAQRLVYLHKETDGLSVLVLTPEEIYNEFSCGKPDVSAFRKLLKLWYDRAGGQQGMYPSYCLLMGRPTYDNKMVTTQVRNSGYPRIPIWQSPAGETESTSFSTDDYIGMLADVDGNFNIATAEINVAVGRMPVKNLSEANAMIDKLERYLLSPELGKWRNNVMVIADDQDKGVHLQQAESVIATMKGSEKGNDYIYEKLYLDAYPLEFTGTGASYPQAHQRMMQRWEEGTLLINYIGHANAKSWGHESLLTWTDINSMTNRRLPFIYAATCDFMRWDADDISGAETLWLLPNSGVIGMICPSREVIIATNGILNESTSKYFFQLDDSGNYLSVGEIMRRGKNDSNTGNNKLRYGLIGDPSLKLPRPSSTIKVDTINGVYLETSDELPIISAGSNVKITGHIEDKEGNLLSDFNGTAELTLFDAEKVIKTNGNGADGVESVYNDRNIRLFSGRVKVTDGNWSTDFMMPSEIENNYSSALLSLYAYEEKGREANGSCDKLFVYGYDETAPEDFEGPKIIEFYLNYPNFVNGSEVGPDPMLVAKFFDESGINVSEAGIAHGITLELDGSKFYDDIAQYYTPDEDNSKGGTLNYLLTDLETGKHTLKFTVWDNANNSSSEILEFSLSALWKPSIETLYTDMNPATSNVNFIIGTNGSTSSMDCIVEVFDLSGRRIWKENAPALTKGNTRTILNWDLCDFGGSRLTPGIYIYKATIETETGIATSKTNKLIVR